MSTPIIFPLPEHDPLLGRALTERSAPARGSCELSRFPNGELYVRIGSPVAARVCAVLGSLAPPHEQTLSVLLLAHTLEREGARRVVAMLPYLGYARQDRVEPRQSLGAGWVGDLLCAMGVDRVLTIDVHSRRAAACFPMPVDSLSPAPLFADVLVQRGLVDVSVVAPDEGALERCEAVIRAAGIRTPLAYLRKQRDADGVTHSSLVGTVTSRVVIVDDILDTGGTLVSACTALRQAGAQEITVFATHGLFTGQRWRELPALGVQRIYTTDSIPAAREHGGDVIEVLPVGRLIVDAFAAIADSQLERTAAPVRTAGRLSVVEEIEGPAPAEDSSLPAETD
ncbi:MAG TPA: ribose-phosphate diphosphokinase [Solirubrobacteraceae bacterium]|nr:ribose-phosphate diphosphokinase [Solirubrobacteraceae bacterium]